MFTVFGPCPRFGCLRNLNKAHPGAYFSDDMFYAAWPPMCFFFFSFLRVLVEVFPLPLLVRLPWRFHRVPFLQQVSVAGDAVVGQKIEGNIPIVELIQPLAMLTFPRSPVKNAGCQGALFRPSISRVCFFIIHECLELSMKHQRFSITHTCFFVENSFLATSWSFLFPPFLSPRSPSPESTAWNSYQALGGYGNLTGDGLVPVDWAHLPGAQQLTIKDCLHSINIAGTTLPTNRFLMIDEHPWNLT